MVIGLSGRFGRHEILSPINHQYNKICDTLGFFKTFKIIIRFKAWSSILTDF